MRAPSVALVGKFVYVLWQMVDGTVNYVYAYRHLTGPASWSGRNKLGDVVIHNELELYGFGVATSSPR